MLPPSRLIVLLKKYTWLLILFLALLAGGIALAVRPQTTPEAPQLPTPLPPLPTSIPAKFEGVLRLSVREAGMVLLTHDDLFANGLEVVNPADLRLFNLGVPQTLWYSGIGDDLEVYFYGHPLDNPYTLENVYFLTTVDNPAPIVMKISDPSLTTPLSSISFPRPLHLEENTLYLPKAEPEQTWYWKNLTAPKTETLEFTLSAPAAGEATLRVALYANTEAANITPDHHLLISLNGTLIADQTWDGRGPQTLEHTFSTETLREGPNTLTLEFPGDTGALVETVMLDWLEITYPRPVNEENSRAGFRGTGGEVDLTDFSTPPFVFDLSLAGDGTPIEIHPSDTLQIPTETDHNYLAVVPNAVVPDAIDANGFLPPLSLSAVQLSPDLSTAQAKYLALGPPDLLEPLQPLLDYRESQGLTTLSIPINAVYDQFGGGLAHPEAIRFFLQYAFENWATPPQYVLLVGDSTYDPRGYQTPPQANRVPSFFRFTIFGGETVSDTAFAQLDGDTLPDLSVGRLPARTPEQISIIVAKTLAYEQTPSQTGNRILAIADGQEASFQTDAQTFLSKFSQDYTPVLLTPPKGDTTAPGQISEILDEGVLFMSYFGHGSVTMLGKDRIFSVEDSAALANKENLPIMLNSTCLAGLFTHPEAESLTESMLWNPDGGAVAALSATSLTIPTDQAYLMDAFVAAFLANPDASLGDLLLLAQRQIPVEQEGVREVMDTFLLFGDPALKLP